MSDALLHLIATRPQLLVEHAQAYADLALAEVELASVDFKRSLLLQVGALWALGVAAVLGGMAIMLWTVAPTVSPGALWVLIATPLLPLAMTGWCLLQGCTSWPGTAFAGLRQQVQADLGLMHEMGLS